MVRILPDRDNFTCSTRIRPRGPSQGESLQEDPSCQTLAANRVRQLSSLTTFLTHCPLRIHIASSMPIRHWLSPLRLSSSPSMFVRCPAFTPQKKGTCSTVVLLNPEAHRYTCTASPTRDQPCQLQTQDRAGWRSATLEQKSKSESPTDWNLHNSAFAK